MSIQERANDIMETAKGKATALKLAGTTMVMTAVPAMTALAAEGDASSGSSLIEGEIMNAITGAFGDLAVTATQVIAISVVTGCGLVGMSAAAKYAMKKIKAVLSSAA